LADVRAEVQGIGDMMPPSSLVLDATDCYSTLKQGNQGLLGFPFSEIH